MIIMRRIHDDGEAMGDLKLGNSLSSDILFPIGGHALIVHDAIATMDDGASDSEGDDDSRIDVASHRA